MTSETSEDQRYPTMDSRMREYGITMQCGAGKRVTRAPLAASGWLGWDHDAYRVRLSCQGRTMTLTYRLGTGHQGSPPQLAEILDSLASDSSGVDNAESFEEWAGEYGYDTDSRAAEATYKATVDQARKFRALIGDADRFAALLYETERM